MLIIIIIIIGKYTLSIFINLLVSFTCNFPCDKEEFHFDNVLMTIEIKDKASTQSDRADHTG